MATYTTTVDPNGGADYTSLSAWEAGQQSGHTSGDIVIADCRRTGATKDTTAVDISGWTSGVIPKIIVNSSYRHQGKWEDQRSDGNYIYVLQSTAGTVLNIAVTSGCYIDGLLVNITGTTSPRYGIKANNTSYVSNCIIKDSTTSGVSRYGLSANTTASYFMNCVLLGNGVDTGRGYYGSYGRLYNCTAYNWTVGIGTADNTTIVTNCFVAGCGTTYSGTFSGSSNYNISNDGTAPGSSKLLNKTAYSSYFVDYTNGDLHLKGTTANGGIFGATGLAGTDLSATFTNDLDYITRVTWDIGADEYSQHDETVSSNLQTLTLAQGSIVVVSNPNIQAALQSLQLSQSGVSTSSSVEYAGGLQTLSLAQSPIVVRVDHTFPAGSQSLTLNQSGVVVSSEGIFTTIEVDLQTLILSQASLGFTIDSTVAVGAQSLTLSQAAAIAQASVSVGVSPQSVTLLQGSTSVNIITYPVSVGLQQLTLNSLPCSIVIPIQRPLVDIQSLILNNLSVVVSNLSANVYVVNILANNRVYSFNSNNQCFSFTAKGRKH